MPVLGNSNRAAYVEQTTANSEALSYLSGSDPIGANGAGPSVVIDGTPLRVAMICVAAAGGLAALRWAGFRFNVGVS